MIPVVAPFGKRMYFVSAKYDLAYWFIPKVASSTVKKILVEAELGTPAEYGPGGVHAMARRLSARRRDLSRCWKFTVIRDPVRRLLSAYNDRVVGQVLNKYKGLKRFSANLVHVDPQPALNEFFERLPDYRRYSPNVNHHTRSFTSILGPDLRWLDRVYPIEDLGQLMLDLGDRFGHPVALEHRRKSSAGFGWDDLSPRARDAVLRYTRPDYLLVRDYYTPPSLKREI